MKVNKKQVGIAMVISILLLVASVVVVKAAPAEQGAPRINLGMAIIIGILYYASLSPWFANLGFTVLYRPLVAGMLVGSFACAFAVERYRLKHSGQAARIAWGAVIARLLVILLKVAATLGMTVVLAVLVLAA